MIGRLLTAAIIIFWAIMMTVMIREDVLPAYEAARELEHTPRYSQFESLGQEPVVSQMGIYLRDRRIGFSRGTLRRMNDEIIIENRTELNLSTAAGAMPGLGELSGVQPRLLFKARVYNGRLLEFRLTASAEGSSEPLAIVDGNPVGDKLLLTIRHPGGTEKKEVAFDSRQMLSADMMPAVTPSQLKVGARWPIRTVSPGTFKVNAAWAEVVAREEIIIDERAHDAWHIRIPYGDYEVNAWAAPDGSILKQKIFGFIFLREAPPGDTEKLRDTETPP